MTIVIPDRLFTSKQQVWQWIPTIANTAAPTVAEWTAGFGTQIYYEADQMKYTPTADTAEAQRYSDKYSTITPGRKKMEFPNVETYVDPQAPDSTVYKLATSWALEPTGYLALRAGVDDATAPAAAQNISILVRVKIIDLGLTPPDPSNASDFYTRQFQVLPQSDPIFDVKLAV